MNEPDFQSLPTLLRRSGEGGARPHAAMLRLQADLFVAAPSHSYATIGAFETFALATIPLVDPHTAREVAERIAPCTDTPATVIAALLARGGAVAATVAAGLPAMAEADMAAIAQSGPDLMAEGLALRPDLPDTVIRDLLGRQSAAVDLALARNRAFAPGRVATDILLERARSDDRVAAALLARDDLDGLAKAALFPLADPATKDQILAAIGRVAHLAPPPAPAREHHWRLVTSARRRDEERFRELLKSQAGLPEATLRRVIADERGESLALVLVAIGMEDADAAAIFLSRQPAISHSVERVFALVELVRRTERPVACWLVAAIAGADVMAAREGRHVPVTDPAERPARPAARPAIQPAIPGLIPRRDAPARARTGTDERSA